MFAVNTRARKLYRRPTAKAATGYCKNVQISDTIESAVRISIGTAQPDEIICAFGSLYYIGIIREMFGQ